MRGGNIGRKEREWYPGAIYHLMERGIRRLEIFKEEMDYEIFLIILKKVTEEYEAKVHAYCLQTSRYIHLNPVKAKMAAHPEDYKWSSYRAMIALKDDGITERNRTLSYFKNQSVLRYREFVEDVAHKYVVQESEIKKSLGEDELWLPW